MKDSINRKHNKEKCGMVETSDDRNGVVVNRPINILQEVQRIHAIDSTTGIPIRLVKERCSENRNAEIHANSEYGKQCFTVPVRYRSTLRCYMYRYAQNPGF